MDVCSLRAHGPSLCGRNFSRDLGGRDQLPQRLDAPAVDLIVGGEADSKPLVVLRRLQSQRDRVVGNVRHRDDVDRPCPGIVDTEDVREPDVGAPTMPVISSAPVEGQATTFDGPRRLALDAKEVAITEVCAEVVWTSPSKWQQDTYVPRDQGPEHRCLGGGSL